MAIKRFQIKLTGGEKATAEETGRVVGWRFEFFTCQPAPIALIMNEKAYEVKEGLLIPKDSLLSLKFEGDKTATAGAMLVMEGI